MENYLRTGRPLQIEELANAKNKVTLGFKCNAGTKIQLAKEAQQHGMTLSEYVDTLVLLRHQKQTKEESLKSNSVLLKAEREVESLKSRVVDLQGRLHFYEGNTLIVDMFNAHRGQKVHLSDEKGKQRSITIDSISDIFTVLIMSFSPKSHV